MKRGLLFICFMICINLSFSGNVIKIGFQDSKYKSLKEGITNAASGDTIILESKNFREDKLIIIDKNLVIQKDIKSKKVPKITAAIKIKNANVEIKNINFIFEERSYGLCFESSSATLTNVKALSMAGTLIKIKNDNLENQIDIVNSEFEGNKNCNIIGLVYNGCGKINIENSRFQKFFCAIKIEDLNETLKLKLNKTVLAYNRQCISSNRNTKKYKENFSLFLTITNCRFIENLGIPTRLKAMSMVWGNNEFIPDKKEEEKNEEN